MRAYRNLIEKRARFPRWKKNGLDDSFEHDRHADHLHGIGIPTSVAIGSPLSTGKIGRQRLRSTRFQTAERSPMRRQPKSTPRSSQCCWCSNLAHISSIGCGPVAETSQARQLHRCGLSRRGASEAVARRCLRIGHTKGVEANRGAAGADQTAPATRAWPSPDSSSRRRPDPSDPRSRSRRMRDSTAR